MQLSSFPLLIVALFGFLAFLIQRLYRLGHLKAAERNWLGTLLVILLAWGSLSAYLSSTGVYTSAQFLQLAPGYWLPYLPVVTVITLVMLSAPLRQGLRQLVDGTPDHWLTGIHLVRLLAFGTVIKAAKGLFPETFAGFVGIPDLAFGLSAIPVTFLARGGQLTPRVLGLWHLVGALVILAPVAGLMHVFMQDALFAELFAFPMALGPTLVVPTLVMLNLMVAVRLLERKDC